MLYLFVCKLDMICIHDDVNGYSDEKFYFYFHSSHDRKEKGDRSKRPTAKTPPLFTKTPPPFTKTPPLFFVDKNGICNNLFYSKDDIKKIVSLLYNREGFQCIFRHKCKQIGLFVRVRFSLDLSGIYGWR